MKMTVCLFFVAFLASCDSSKQELDTTKATLSDVTKERDDLKSKVASLQQELDTSKTDLAKEKAENQKMTSAMAVKGADGKGASTDAKAAAAAKGKHGHKS